MAWRSQGGSGRPRELERGGARFATWRARRRRGERIPAALWELAVDLAVLHGVSRTADFLGVGYYALRDRVMARRPRQAGGSPAVTLVEVPPPQVGSVTCVVEVEHKDGTAMRIHSSGAPAADLASLVRVFRESS
jgi:hypothetical protein